MNPRNWKHYAKTAVRKTRNYLLELLSFRKSVGYQVFWGVLLALLVYDVIRSYAWMIALIM
jgi:hypothetical protein